MMFTVTCGIMDYIASGNFSVFFCSVIYMYVWFGSYVSNKTLIYRYINIYTLVINGVYINVKTAHSFMDLFFMMA